MRRSPLRSPPRMRGKVGHSAPSPPTYRITPAYAGKSRCNLPSTAPWKDHPRVCGEKNQHPRNGCAQWGSPPRMRGKVLVHLCGKLFPGITPAYAGKSQSPEYRCPSQGDHPRVCGEKQAAVALPQPVLGSPPRMRGKACLTLIIRLLLGITPAYAGKSTTAGRGRMPSRDHPRVCGEKNAASIWAICARGSPPRVRGKV